MIIFEIFVCSYLETFELIAIEANIIDLCLFLIKQVLCAKIPIVDEIFRSLIEWISIRNNNGPSSESCGTLDSFLSFCRFRILSDYSAFYFSNSLQSISPRG